MNAVSAPSEIAFAKPMIFGHRPQRLFWLSCLMWGILFMIAAATEGFPFTSIHIRDEFSQDAIGGLGLFLALLGVCLGFAVGKTKIAPMARSKSNHRGPR